MAKPKHNRKVKVTITLDEELLRECREAVRAGWVRSQAALVRQALETRLRVLREEQLAREYAAASADPLFLMDLEETERAFDSLDAETARQILPE